MSHVHTYHLCDKSYNPNMGIEYHDIRRKQTTVFAIENYLQDWKAMIGDTVKIETNDKGLSTRVWVNDILVYKSKNPLRKNNVRMMRWVDSRKVRLLN